MTPFSNHLRHSRFVALREAKDASKFVKNGRRIRAETPGVPVVEYFQTQNFCLVPTIFLFVVRLQKWMKRALIVDSMQSDQDKRISDAIGQERTRLRDFIRKRVSDQHDAEDILQEVFYELTEAYRLTKPIEQVGAWLFRVARNRITDLFRRKRTEAAYAAVAVAESDDLLSLEDLLPSRDGGPEAAYARGVLIDELAEALNELPEEQRDVFVAHELDGRSFKELAEQSGISVNTLLSRKHYAVLHLRRRLQDIYDEFTKR